MGNIYKFDFVYYMINKRAGMASHRDGLHTIFLFELDDKYIKQIEPDYPNMVCSQMVFNKETLGLRKKGQYLKQGGIGIGVWEYYNEDGTLHHTEDMDKHFPITWARLEEILKNKDISLLTVDSVSRYYDEEKDEATWSIIIKLPMEKGCLYVFDARTGELLNTKILNMRKQL